MNMQKMGKYIVKLRKGKGWTQQQFAERLSVSPQAVSKWECGESVPYIDMSKEDNLIQQVSKYHETAEFPKIRFKDNTEFECKGTALNFLIITGSYDKNQ